jgi:hypothetical protein
MNFRYSRSRKQDKASPDNIINSSCKPQASLLFISDQALVSTPPPTIEYSLPASVVMHANPGTRCSQIMYIIAIEVLCIFLKHTDLSQSSRN